MWSVTLNGAINSSQTTAVFNTSNFSPGAPYYGMVDSESVEVLWLACGSLCGGAGIVNALILRGVNGTTPASHANGATFHGIHGFQDPGNYPQELEAGGGFVTSEGLYPNWITEYLYTGDIRSYWKMIGDGEIIGNWNVHFREGDDPLLSGNTRRLNRTDTPGLPTDSGTILSTTDRTTFRSEDPCTWSTTIAGDRICQVELASATHNNPSSPSQSMASGFTLGFNRQTDPMAIPYLMTGDTFWLDEIWMWPAFMAVYQPTEGTFSSPATGANNGRGPTDAGSYVGASKMINGDTGNLTVREEGNTYRQLSRAQSYTPDIMPEKAFFTIREHDWRCSIAGAVNITTDSDCPGSDSMWNWSKTQIYNLDLVQYRSTRATSI